MDIGTICTIVGTIITVGAFFYSWNKDSKNRIKMEEERRRSDEKKYEERRLEETKRETLQAMQLDQIRQGIDRMERNDIKRDERLKTIETKIIVLEKDTDALYKNQEILFKRFNRLDEHYQVLDEIKETERYHNK